MENKVLGYYLRENPSRLLELHRESNGSLQALLDFAEREAKPVFELAVALTDAIDPESEALDPGAIAEALAQTFPQRETEDRVSESRRQMLEDWIIALEEQGWTPAD